MLEEIKQILTEVLPECDTSTVTPDSVLTSDIGIDSMKMLLLAMQIEDKYGFQFGEDANFDTIRDLMDYIEAHRK